MKGENLLVVESHYSFLDGCRSPSELVAAAAVAGYGAVALCDRYGIHGWPELVRAADEQGIVPLMGLTVSTPGGGDIALVRIDSPGGFRINQIATRTAWKRRAMQNGVALDRYERKMGTPHFPEASCSESWDIVTDLLIDGWDGLAVLCESEAVASLLGRRNAERVFLCIPGRDAASFPAVSDFSTSIPRIAVEFADSINDDDLEFLTLLRESRHKGKRTARNGSEPGKPFGPPVPWSQRSRELELLPDAIESAHILIDTCRSRFAKRHGNARRSDRVPVAIAPDGPDPTLQPPATEARKTRDELRTRCKAGFFERYAGGNSTALNRLEGELVKIAEARLESYFLTVHDVVRRFPHASGRGSAGASIVCYVLGITHVDPVSLGLPFERFLSPARSEPPDIDLDFPWDERHEALDYILRRFAGRAALVGDYIRFGLRSSLRWAARVLGYGEGEIRGFIDARNQDRSEDIPAEVKRIATRLEGMPRSSGTHTAGIVITSRRVLDYCSVWPSELGYPVLVWNKTDVSAAGLVKIDCIGNRSFAALRDCITLVSKHHGVDLGWDDNRGLSDQDTQKMFARGESIGVFYVESPATRQLLAKMKRGDFEHLVVATSIIRPSSKGIISEYLRRLHGGSWKHGHKRLESVLSATYGVLVFQEDVSRIAASIAGFAAAKRDRLRRIVCNKDPIEALNTLESSFYGGARERGIEAASAREAWDSIRTIVGYSFTKAHSASCALVAFRLGWLKRHFPAEFFACIINNGGGYYSRQVYINEARRVGVEILPPDVAESDAMYTISHGALRVGLNQLSGLSQVTIDRIVAARTEVPFRDLRDFLIRTEPGQGAVRVLIRSGALDAVGNGLTRPAMFWIADNLDSQTRLFPLTPPNEIADYSDRTRIQDERETLGLFVRSHPIESLRAAVEWKLRRNSISPTGSADLAALGGERVCALGCPVAFKEVATQSGRCLCFASFEDIDGVYETVLEPRTYERYRASLSLGVVFAIFGLVELDYGVPMLNIKRILTLI